MVVPQALLYIQYIRDQYIGCAHLNLISIVHRINCFFLIYCEVNIVATNIVYSPPITNDSTHPSAFPAQPFTPLLMTSSVCSYALITLSYSTPATPINTTEQFTCDTTWMAQPLLQLLRYTNCFKKYDKFHYIHSD